MRCLAISTWLISILAVAAAPAVALTVSPGAGRAGEVVALVIHEPDIIWAPDVHIDLGPAIAPVYLARLADGALLATVAIDAAATPGPRDITVADGLRSVTASGIFTVSDAGGGGGGIGDQPANALINPGFETGDMTGWIPSTWSVDTVLPHGGVYDGYDPGATGGGGLCIRQNFNPPIDSDDIQSFTFWIRQPDDLGIAQVAVFHQNAGGNYGVAFTNDNDSWTFQDQTALVLPNDFVVGIHVCGFGGGAPTADDSWIDDFIFDDGSVPVEPSSWGAIKALLR